MVNPFLDAGARLVIAHRGNRIAAPENTLEALREARDMGADALEFDVRLSRDAVPMVMHDAELDRTTDGHGLLAGYTAAELRTLNAAARRAPARRSVIPMLEELLDEFRETPLVIEIKELAAAEPTVGLVERFGARDRVLIGSAVQAVVDHVAASGLAVCASTREAASFIPAALLGRRPATPRFHVLSVTPRYLGLPIPISRLAAAARKVGLPTQVWTVNDTAVAVRLWRAGIGGLVTDDPGALLGVRSR